MFDDPKSLEAWTSYHLRDNVKIDDIWVEGARDPLPVGSGFPAGTQSIGLAIKPQGQPADGVVVGRARILMDASVNGAPFRKTFDLTPDRAVVLDGRGLSRLNLFVLASNIGFAAFAANPIQYMVRAVPTPFVPVDSGVDRHAWLYESYASTSVTYQVPQDADGFVVATDDPGMTFEHYNDANPAAFVSFPWAAIRGSVQPIGGRFFRVGNANQAIAWRIRL